MSETPLPLGPTLNYWFCTPVPIPSGLRPAQFRWHHGRNQRITIPRTQNWVWLVGLPGASVFPPEGLNDAYLTFPGISCSQSVWALFCWGPEVLISFTRSLPRQSYPVLFFFCPSPTSAGSPTFTDSLLGPGSWAVEPISWTFSGHSLDHSPSSESSCPSFLHAFVISCSKLLKILPWLLFLDGAPHTSALPDILNPSWNLVRYKNILTSEVDFFKIINFIGILFIIFDCVSYVKLEGLILLVFHKVRQALLWHMC